MNYKQILKDISYNYQFRSLLKCGNLQATTKALEAMEIEWSLTPPEAKRCLIEMVR